MNYKYQVKKVNIINIKKNNVVISGGFITVLKKLYESSNEGT